MDLNDYYQGKTISCFLRSNGFRYSGEFLEAGDGFITLRRSDNEKTVTLNMSDIEIVKEEVR